MVKIDSVKGVVTYTSRGSHTIDINLFSSKGVVSSFASPSGASVGAKEVPMFPGGKVSNAMGILSSLSNHLRGFEYNELSVLDGYVEDFDGTGCFGRIGSAISLGVSVAGAELAANEEETPLFYWLSNGHPTHIPIPLGNVVGGGKHSLGKSIDIQEILVFPCNAKRYSDAYGVLVDVHKRVGKFLSKKDRCFNGGRNDEGAWTTSLPDEEAIQVVREAMDEVESESGLRLCLGLDVAASSLWDDEVKKYFYPRRRVYLDTDEQINYILDLIDMFDIKYVEDPLEENDFSGYSILTRAVHDSVYIVGDDLFVTNKSRISLGINKGSCNGVIIKPNQVGNLTKTKDAVEEAGRGKYIIVVSHRSGETSYPHLSHVALALGGHLFKAGIIGGERVVKHNEIIRIEELYGGINLVSIRV